MEEEEKVAGGGRAGARARTIEQALADVREVRQRPLAVHELKAARDLP